MRHETEVTLWGLGLAAGFGIVGTALYFATKPKAASASTYTKGGVVFPNKGAWAPATSVTKGKTYRASIPGVSMNTPIGAYFQVIAPHLETNPVSTTHFYDAGATLPNDWPSDDRETDRHRAQFVAEMDSGVLPLPPGLRLYEYVYTTA